MLVVVPVVEGVVKIETVGGSLLPSDGTIVIILLFVADPIPPSLSFTSTVKVIS